MPKRILIVRLSAIGDSLLSVPVLNALRRNWPDSEIGWVIEGASAQLIQGHVALDKLFVASKSMFKSPRKLWEFGRTLKSWKPDVTIDLQGLTKSSLLAWLSGAKSRLGFHRDQYDGRELSTWFNNQLFHPESKHIVDRSIDLLGLMGVSDKRVEFNLPEREQDAIFAEDLLRFEQIEGRYGVINVGAGWPSKIWPSDRYAAVARHLERHWGIRSLILWSGPEERLAAEHVHALSGGSTVIAPATSLTQLSSIVRRACIFVGSDTGPMHLSVALGTPTIGMIGPMPIERVAPYGPQHVGIQRERLPESRQSERKSECAPMLSIQVDDVLQGCDRIMERIIKREKLAA